MTEDEQHRRWFHTTNGSFDLVRLVENLVPAAIIGMIVIYSNSIVTQSQVRELSTRLERTEDKVTSQNERLIGLNAQVTAYLGQQTQLNVQMDARMTYLERAMNSTNAATTGANAAMNASGRR